VCIAAGRFADSITTCRPSATRLSDAQIESVIKYLWTLCDDPRWPRGDLNFPRAFFTEKAFPESEAVWTTGITAKGAKAVANELVYEHRIKQRSQYEVTIPIEFQQVTPSGPWVRGLGDVEFALRRTFWASLDHAAIVAAGGAVTVPTGKDEVGVGEGATIWEPFAMFAKGLGANGFVQLHGGYMASSRRTNVETQAICVRRGDTHTRRITASAAHGRRWPRSSGPKNEVVRPSLTSCLRCRCR
jgi:hypothetical protein